jgi:DNA-binding PadR family transcriptional regulator
LHQRISRPDRLEEAMPASPSPDPMFDVRSLIDRLQATFAPGGDDEGGDPRDVRAAILVELAGASEPMHGHQLITAIAARSGGAWTPAPGALYPTLQLLTDEGLVTAALDGERRVYALTETGRTAAASASATTTPGSRDGARPQDLLALPRSGAKFAQALAQFGRDNTPDQRARAVAIVDEARRRLYAILAED